MALSKKITLSNGIETSYHVVDMIESIPDLNITKVKVDSFTSKEIYKKAIEKDTLLKEQQELVDEFDKLVEIEKPTKTQENKMNKLQTQINELADEISELKAYEVYVADSEVIDLPYQEDLSNQNINKVLKTTTKFKSATILV